VAVAAGGDLTRSRLASGGDRKGRDARGGGGGGGGDGGGGEGGGGGGGGGAGGGGGGGRGGGGGPRRCASAEQHHVQSTAATVAQRAPLASRADAPRVVAPELLPEWAAPHARGAHGII